MAPSSTSKASPMIARAQRISALDAYVSVVIALGALCAVALAISGAGDLQRLLSPEALMFFLFAFFGEFVPLKVFTRGAEGEVTTSTTFALAAMLVAGPLAGLVALGLANVLAASRGRKPLQKIAFNLFQYAITVGAAGLVLNLTTNLPRAGEPHLAPSDLPGILLAAAVFFLVNILLVSTVVALAQRASVFSYMVRDLFFQASINGLMLGLAPIVVLAADFALPAIALLFLPIFAVHRAALPADLRRPPRRPRGDREGAPGAPRRAHRAPEPRTVQGPHRSDRPHVTPQRRQRGRDDHGPRSLQGDQRHARPSHGRSVAPGGLEPAAARPARLGHRGPPRRRRVRRPAPERQPPRGRGRRRPAAAGGPARAVRARRDAPGDR